MLIRTVGLSLSLGLVRHVGRNGTKLFSRHWLAIRVALVGGQAITIGAALVTARSAVVLAFGAKDDMIWAARYQRCEAVTGFDLSLKRH